MLLRCFILCSLLLWIELAQSAGAVAKQMLKSPAMLDLDEGIRQTWSCSQVIPSGKYTDIEIQITADGFLKLPLITHSSLNNQYDAECLESVCARSPVSGGSPADYTVRFGHPPKLEGVIIEDAADEDVLPKYFGLEVKQCLAEILKTEGLETFVFLHKIPPVVLCLKPGLFAREVILNQSNLLRFPDENRGVGGLSERDGKLISRYYLELSRFMAQKNCSANSIENFANQLFLKVVKNDGG